MNKKTIKDIDIKGKRVFIRVDFNVPIKSGVIEDDTRIRGALPTIEYAIEQGAKVILADEPIASLDPESSRRVARERVSEAAANAFPRCPCRQCLMKSASG